jgi:hypothetical protein
VPSSSFEYTAMRPTSPSAPAPTVRYSHTPLVPLTPTSPDAEAESSAVTEPPGGIVSGSWGSTARASAAVEPSGSVTSSVVAPTASASPEIGPTSPSPFSECDCSRV